MRMRHLAKFALMAAFMAVTHKDVRPGSLPAPDPETVALSVGDHDAILRFLTTNPVKVVPVARTALGGDGCYELPLRDADVEIARVLSDPATATGIYYEQGRTGKLIPREALEDLQKIATGAAARHGIPEIKIFVCAGDTFDMRAGKLVETYNDNAVTYNVVISTKTFEQMDLRALRAACWHEIEHLVNPVNKLDENEVQQKFEVSADSMMYAHVGRDEALRTLKILYQIEEAEKADPSCITRTALELGMSASYVAKMYEGLSSYERSFRQESAADHPPLALRILLIDLLDKSRQDPQNRTAAYMSVKNAYKF